MPSSIGPPRSDARSGLLADLRLVSWGEGCFWVRAVFFFFFFFGWVIYN